MGWSLAEMNRRMTSAEFGLHLQLEVQQSEALNRREPEEEWD